MVALCRKIPAPRSFWVVLSILSFLLWAAFAVEGVITQFTDLQQTQGSFQNLPFYSMSDLIAHGALHHNKIERLPSYTAAPDVPTVAVNATLPATALPLFIPDRATRNVSFTLDTDTVKGATDEPLFYTLDVEVEHTYPSDLRMEIIPPSGETLYAGRMRWRRSTAQFDGAITEGPATGDWTLVFEDSYYGDEGYVVSLNLEVLVKEEEKTAKEPVEACKCPEGRVCTVCQGTGSHMEVQSLVFRTILLGGSVFAFIATFVFGSATWSSIRMAILVGNGVVPSETVEKSVSEKKAGDSDVETGKLVVEEGVEGTSETDGVTISSLSLKPGMSLSMQVQKA
uniref:P/Homo B domain-containing protein n=1 Tax=Chromera velia CCMP2878 TaxID=1169474 RepID=A0A0G4F5N9_9ALVE|mmetsp:Transcript_53743/g.105105  ORF Transcript_53743/g.105105 Transcript_53743/m.105105 type:complete len:340 (+) Transcript_53743:119-1138(+)|eukprot:Cvel_15184.t1-p1 / transcript=Cvel_15184.t1 / gene=Cvel_15184 / organism=Chromera_velia_CCMP2878 / gene_product=hypothetical protein / transcript_product=hypothetical protein / location=Cvel_scaffold1110:17899-19491(-) / protein_length=339 / sequence_SO=supercontig / SO=protein_coding / is_pseudo=false